MMHKCDNDMDHSSPLILHLKQVMIAPYKELYEKHKKQTPISKFFQPLSAIPAIIQPASTTTDTQPSGTATTTVATQPASTTQ